MADAKNIEVKVITTAKTVREVELTEDDLKEIVREWSLGQGFSRDAEVEFMTDYYEAYCRITETTVQNL